MSFARRNVVVRTGERHLVSVRMRVGSAVERARVVRARNMALKSDLE